MKEDFVLPEKWYIKTDEESNDTVCDWYDKIKKTKTDRTIGNFYCVDGSDKPRGWMYYAPDRIDGYTKISFKKFKKYVLGMKEQEQQKEIMGWRLKDECKEYEKYALLISTATRFIPSQDGTLFSNSSYISEKLKQAGVLDLWFEPVYKKEEEFKVGDWVTLDKSKFNKSFYDSAEYYCSKAPKNTWRIEMFGNNGNTQWENMFVIVEGFDYRIPIDCIRKASPKEIKAAQTPQIIINDYRGEFFSEYVKFGCAEIDKDLIINLYNTNSITYRGTRTSFESVTIGKGTFSKEQIKAIAEYYLNKK